MSVARRCLEGTIPLEDNRELALEMVVGIRAYLERELETRKRRRSGLVDLNPNAVQERRKRLAKILGVVDAREPVDDLELYGTLSTPAKVASYGEYEVYRLRWPVLAGVEGEGLLLRPRSKSLARVIAIPDARWMPEMVAGLVVGGMPFGSTLARAGCEVVMPVLISRNVEWSGNPELAMTNQTHREYIYRMAYEMGRHVIGYEIQKLLALVDYWTGLSRTSSPIGVFGYGEGGMLAFYAGALDTRIDVVGVSGFYGDRFQMWRHPIERNVWGLLKGFSDAEVVTLIAPRRLVVEASTGPLEQPAPSMPERSRGRTASPGELTAIPVAEAEAEGRLAQEVYEAHGVSERFAFVVPESETREPGSPGAIGAFLKGLGIRADASALCAMAAAVAKATAGENADAAQNAGEAPTHTSSTMSADQESKRQRRQLYQLVQHVQRLMYLSPKVRKAFFWDRLDLSTLERYEQSCSALRAYLWEEVIGRLPAFANPGPVESRFVKEEDDYEIFEVKLPLDETVFAFGALLLPKDLRDGERRPVVVCQHGLESHAEDTYRTGPVNKSYRAYAARLAQRGYVVYAPQNPYIGGHEFRTLQRMANPLGLSLFSFILAQHNRTLEWLAAQSFVDAERIAFYGLSYGGKTAMRVPALLGRYCLSICSGDFNEWIVKNVAWDWPFSYIYTAEYEMPEFDLGHTFNYAEMAALIAPRPFMVERGSKDKVGEDEWVSFEYAKVRRLYADLGIVDRTKMAVFNGPHVIDSTETFPFLDRQLGFTPRVEYMP